MKTQNLKLILISFAVFLFTNIQVNAQDGKIDFSRFTIGKNYKVILTTGMEFNGTLLKVNDVTIELKTETDNLRIKKNDIAEISKSYEFFKGGNVQDTNLKTMQLKDGSEMIGHVRSKDSLKIKFETLSGAMIDVRRNQIESIVDERSDYSLGDDPNKTRLFFAPTGKNLKAGTGYFSVHELLFPMLAFGITDFFTVAGGISILPGASDQLYYLNGKARALHIKDLDLSAGILYTNVTSNNESGVTVLYGNGTYGTNNASLTLGAGLSFNSDATSSGKYPMFILGGEIKLSNSAKFITENWIPTEPDSYKIFSFGVRFFGKRLAGDFGLIYIMDEVGKSAMGEGWPFIPWIGLNYNFDM
jgi:hypothetical protein